MRKSVMLDERDIEIVAVARAKYPNKWSKRAAVIGFIFIVIGGLLEVNGKMYGFGIMGVGAILIGLSMVYNNKHFIKAKKEFIEKVKQSGELPPWPEEKAQ